MAAKKSLTKLQKLAILELLDSSSSDSSDEEELWLLADFLEKREAKKGNKFVDVINSYDDETFRQNLRLSRDSFKKLVILFNQSEFMPKSTCGRKAISPELHILVFLWFAGRKIVSRVISELFNVTTSSFDRILVRVMAFFHQIKPQVIRMPQTPELKAKIADKFRRIAKFPSVIGCIDCSYIPIRTPSSMQRQSTLTLQGVCDSNGKFLDVATGFSSQTHDSRIFKMSEIYPQMSEICGPHDTYHFLGDPDYALSATLLKPFPDTGCLTLPEKRYNKSLSQTRAKIENAFGLLKGRFKQLTRLDFHTVKKQSDFIIACCVLHNLCILWNEEEFEPQEDEGQLEEQDQFEDTTPEDKEIGEMKRRTIVSTVFP